MPEVLEPAPMEMGGIFDDLVAPSPFADWKPDRGVVGTAVSALKRGGRQLESTGFGLAGVIADTFGADQFAKSFMRGYTQSVAQAGLHPSEIGTFSNINGAGDAFTYAIEGLFENVPNIAMSAVGGGIGAATAKGIAGRAVAAKLAERQIGEEAAKRFTQIVIGNAAETGAVAGGSLANVGQEVGSIGGDIFSRTGEVKPLESLIGGTIAGAIETVADAKWLRQAFGKAQAAKLEEAFKDKAGRVLGAGLKQTQIEGFTEAAQTLVEEASAWHAQNEPDKPFWTEDLRNAIVDSYLKSLLPGGVMGSGGQLMQEVRKKEQVRGLREAAQRNIDAGNKDTGEKLKAKADDLEFQPMTVEEMKKPFPATTTTLEGKTVLVNPETGTTVFKASPTPEPPVAAEPTPTKETPAAILPVPDFEKLLQERGVTAEEHARNSALTDDLVPMPEQFAGKVAVQPSEISGQGLFITGDVAAGEEIAPAMLVQADGIKRTEAGRFINHSADANTTMIVRDGQALLVAKRPLAEGEELTVNYREQPAVVVELRKQSAVSTQPVQAPGLPEEKPSEVKPPSAPAKAAEGVKAEGPDSYPVLPEKSASARFQDWRIQGNTIRHSVPGKVLTEAEGQAIMEVMPSYGIRGRWDATKKAVVVNSGLMSDAQRMWSETGSIAKKTQVQRDRAAEVEARREQAESARNEELKTSPSAAWIDSVFGSEAMNAFNKAELAKFLEGKTQKFGGQPNPKWQTGLSTLGVTSLEELRNTYIRRTASKPAEVRPAEADSGQRPTAKPLELMTPEEALSRILRAKNRTDAEDVLKNEGALVLTPSTPWAGSGWGVLTKDGKIYGGLITSTPSGKASINTGHGYYSKPKDFVQSAANNFERIPVAMVEKFSPNLPDGYIREGDRYVFKPQSEKPAEAKAKMPWEMTRRKAGIFVIPEEVVGTPLGKKLEQSRSHLEKEIDITDEWNSIGSPKLKQQIATSGWSVVTNRQGNKVLVGRTESALANARRHKASVQQAIREGKPVPPEVLADYPDLKPSPANQEAQSVQKYRVGKSPQTYSLLERLPQSESEKNLGEQPVRVRNDKTGETQTVLESDLTPVRTVPQEEKAAKPGASLDEKLAKLGYKDVSTLTEAEKKLLLKRGQELSVGEPPRQPLTVPQTESAIQELFKDGQSPPGVTVVHDETLMHNGLPVAGYYDPTDGSIVINSAYISTPEQARAVFLEEAFHAVRNSPEVAGALNRLLSSLTPEQIAKTKAEYGTGTSDYMAGIEAVADLIQQEQLSSEQRGMLQSLWEAIKRAVSRLYAAITGDFPSREADIRSITAKALKAAAEGARTNLESHLEYSVVSTGESKTSKALEEFQFYAESRMRAETWKGRDEQAARFIDETHGGDLEKAWQAIALAAPVGMPDALRIIIAADIAIRASNQFRQTLDSRNIQLARQAGEVAKQTASGGGQTLNAANQAINKMAADDAMLTYWSANNDAIDKFLSAKFPDVVSHNIKAWLVESGQKAVKQVAELMTKTNNVTSKVLRLVGKEGKVNWAELFTSSAVDQKQWQSDLFAKIREHPKLQNLGEAEAGELANILSEAWQRERRKIFLREFKKQVKLPEVNASDAAKLESALPELIRQLNLGLFENEAFRNAVAPRYGEKPVSSEQALKVYEMAQKAQAQPEGFQRNQAFREVYDEMRRSSGISGKDIITAWWYASVLSGSGTQARNIVGNAGLLMEAYAASVARNPKAASVLWSAMVRGMRDNIMGGEFRAIMSGHVAARQGMDIAGAAGTLELLKDSPKKWERMLAIGRYVTRFMLAADSFFYDAAAEVAATNQVIAQNRKATWSEVNAKIYDRLNLSPVKRQIAEAQAKAEKLTGNDFKRRVIEILENERPSEILEAQNRFALEATLNNDPQGLLGTLAHGLMLARERVPLLTAVVPFIRISANVGNVLLQHSPLGLYWVLRNWRTEGANWQQMKTGRSTGNIIGIRSDITPEEYQQLRAKVLLSHGALMMAFAWAASGLDEKDPWFQVTGSMQGVDPDRRRQLEQQGIRPYSVKFGNRSFDYRLTPWATGFAYVGQVMDAKRYIPKWDEQEMTVKLATALMGGKAVILDQSFLSNLMVLLERGPQLAKDQNSNKYITFLARTAGGAIPSILKESDSWFSPQIRNPSTAWDLVQREIPFYRRDAGTPVINILGEPVERPRYPWSWLTSEASDDPVWQALGEKAQKGAFLPVPTSAVTILQNGKRVKMTPEQFAAYQREIGKLYRAKLERDLSRFSRMTPEQAQEYFKREFEPLREMARSKVR